MSNSSRVFTMTPDAKSRSVLDARSQAGAERFGLPITARRPAPGRTSAPLVGDFLGEHNAAAPENGDKPHATNPCARPAEVSTENCAGEGSSLLASIDLTQQDPLPDSDGKIRCALIWCPEVPGGTSFSLIRRDDDGKTEKLEGGVLMERTPSLNLARLRQRGAQLGANEVVLILPQACASLD